MSPEGNHVGRMDRPADARLDRLDASTAALVRLAARITSGSESSVRDGFAECADARVPDQWIEELVLQSYLFAGFPRCLNAAREFRRGARVMGEEDVRSEEGGVGSGEGYGDVYEWRVRGEETCRIVYGEFYDKLRGNIRRLHPALDDWMIVEGYGKVLSRPGLDLGRRELCIVAACLAAEQDRQLHSHLHGARNAGVPNAVVDSALGVLAGLVSAGALDRARLLWERVKGK